MFVIGALKPGSEGLRPSSLQPTCHDLKTVVNNQHRLCHIPLWCGTLWRSTLPYCAGSRLAGVQRDRERWAASTIEQVLPDKML
jgi:hypothetical protein